MESLLAVDAGALEADMERTKVHQSEQPREKVKSERHMLHNELFGRNFHFCRGPSTRRRQTWSRRYGTLTTTKLINFDKQPWS